MTEEKTDKSIWDKTFGGREYARYPHEEVIRFVARHFYKAPDRSKVKLLDLGCGPGADLWYMAREGFDVAAYDGSEVGLQRAKGRLDEEGKKGDLRHGSFEQIPWADATFDGVVDVRAIQCNSFATAKKIVAEVHRVLKPGGWFYSSILSNATYAVGKGREVEPNGFTDITEGPLAGLGFNLLLSRVQVDDLYRIFPVVRLERHSITVGQMTWTLDAWNVEAQKA